MGFLTKSVGDFFTTKKKESVGALEFLGCELEGNRYLSFLLLHSSSMVLQLHGMLCPYSINVDP